MVQINVQQGQGLIATFKRELKAQEGVDTSKVDGSVWAEVMKEVSAQNNANKAAGEKEIFRGGDDMYGSGSKNFVVNVGIIEIAQNLWDKIVALLTGKKPEQTAADDKAPVAKEKSTPVQLKVEQPAADEIPSQDTNPPADCSDFALIKELPKDTTPPPTVRGLVRKGGTKTENSDGTYTLKYNDGTSVQYKNGKAVAEYDANGNLTRQILRNDDGSVITYKDNVFDVDGNKTRDIFRKPDGTVSSFTDYEYDANGNNTRFIYRNVDGSVKLLCDYEYDAKGNITRDIDRNTDGTVISYTDHVYDAKGNITRYIERNTDGSVKELYDYEYDAKGNRTRDIERNADGSVKELYDYEYDAKGNITRYIERDANGNVSSYTDYKYDDDGNIISKIEYDPDGNVISE